ncbi:hypothetical protein BU23DRAFT_593520 [Bimuria novae-zelandiae CBS 107.79]|uniref:HTH CENPB-type domain-containing protein n=1 Tax=Bimuria novae-zelandiae CBS 107.79 TaxID=1447943 RepID=A0A6A5ULF9_9PLEO|nr:hypothetical protein BU23DRAFT_593520 [Bimuria novae-zelandiae CBS 107.79]
MALINNAIAAYNAQELGKKLSVTTLRRRQQGSQQSRTTKDLNQRALSPQQEQALLQHINKLTERRLPPTKEIMRNFALSKAIDAVRHHANSYLKYRLYFNLLHEKMAQYNIQACNTYNIDEKGFLIGILGRSKRIFNREIWERKEVTAALQDGEREFVTCLATICADGSALPPGLIFAALGGLRDTWVAGIEDGAIMR